MKKNANNEKTANVVANANDTKGKGFNALCLEVTNRVIGNKAVAIQAAINAVYEDRAATDDRYKQLQADFEHAKARFEKKQLDSINSDKVTLKAFRRAVAVVVAALAAETKTAAWFNYRALYKLGYLDKMPKEVNTAQKVSAFVRDTFTAMQAAAKRKAAAESKDAAIAAIAAKFGVPVEAARAMYVAGCLKA